MRSLSWGVTRAATLTVRSLSANAASSRSAISAPVSAVASMGKPSLCAMLIAVIG